jgi:hypothetical protein
MVKTRPSSAYLLSSNGGFFIIILSLIYMLNNFSFLFLLAFSFGLLIVIMSYFIFITLKHVREVGVIIIILALFTLALSPIYVIGFIFCLIGGIIAIRWNKRKN